MNKYKTISFKLTRSIYLLDTRYQISHTAQNKINYYVELKQTNIVLKFLLLQEYDRQFPVF